MKGKHWLAVCTMAGLSLAACTATYPVVGKFNDHNEVFLGTVNHDLLNGQAVIEAKGKNTGLVCRGNSQVTSIPFDNYALPTCFGQRGMAFLSCDDGRSIDADWIAESCTSGYGSGQDQNGVRFDFAFGMSEQEATGMLRQFQRTVASKPILPPFRPRTRPASRL